MLKVYNPNCKMASVKIHDKFLFDRLRDHFLTFVHRPDVMFGSSLKDEIIISEVVVESVLRNLKEIALISPSKDNIDREIALKRLLGIKGMMLINFVSEELFDEIEPLES